MPPCESYDGTGDPMEHLARFTSGMNLHLVLDQIMCRAFPVTLKGAAHVWFQHLTPRSISCWAQLAESFRSNFLTSRVQRKNSSALFRIVQGPKESLKSYYARFNSEKLPIDHLDPGVTFAAMARGVRPSTPLRFSLNKRPPENMSDLLDRVEKYLRAEEDSTTSQHEEAHNGHKRQDRPERGNSNEAKRSRATLPKSFTPLNTSQGHILNQVKSQNILKWPKPMRGPADKRDSQLYCHFHKDHGHTTDECKVLQREIENLITKGHLKQFIKANDRQQNGRRNQRRTGETQPKDPPVINTISGGPSAGGLSSSSRKAYARHVNLTQGSTKRPRTSTSLEFNDADLDGISLPHDDALVITLRVDAFNIKRFLVDTGSSADIIFEDAFNQMGISDDRVKPISSPLYGFTGASAPVRGIASLTIVVGEPPRQAVHTLDFLIAKIKSSYNGILGRTGLNKLQAVASTYHLVMKFPTPVGVGLVKGDQTLARRCYVASCRTEETLSIDDQRDGKEYLASPPLLSKPVMGEDLFLYLAVAESAVSAVLVREQDGQQLPVYYVSKVLQGAEQRYPNAEKLAFALLNAARKLRPYFQSHTITVLTDKPLRRILHKPDLSGRLIPWSVELGEFDIHYRPRPSIKGQALADFIVECTLPIEVEETPLGVERPLLPDQLGLFTWTLYVDGSSNTSGNVLYKRSFTLPYLRCLTTTESDYALREVHEGICGQHLGGRALAHKVLRQGYYWPTMHRDALDYTKKCDACQRFSSIPRQSPSPLSSLTSPIPFAMWGMDIMGPFPPATAQRRFWTTSLSGSKLKLWLQSLKRNVKISFWRAVVCRFGIPRVLVTDNGKQFDNPTFRTFCANLSIEQRFTSVAHPQTNGQTEVTNRTLLQGIKKKLNGAKGLWVDELPKILWAYNTTTRTSTGETPFSLSFGTDALIPVEIGLPSLRVVTDDPAQNEEDLRANLDLLDERREQAAVRLAAYKHRVSKFYDQRVQHRAFRVGDLVLRRIEASAPREAVGKLAPNWEGPYRVVKLAGPGAYHLEHIDGKAIPRTWNAANLRRYYA
ncbi:hypothetical protein RJ639_026117 [Escallonia herrerae]|uniref:Integrase catalytic domain-containing protein n=1 Tax=Escallonia herrerae TaxID=1293975 RepID=A0AA88SCW2_9ASTE|nr:hypothetical protein RJ639_026117 [Escallonia herrerae]